MTGMLLNDRYRIIQTLGSGGFGETFLAEDTQMPSLRRCVIKQLKPIVNNPVIYEVVQQRFQREAAILEQLGDHSDRIPKLYAYFTTNGLFYLVQEWIEGKTLSTLVKQQGVLSENAVQEILMSLLTVLDYVHKHGIIHRDIKPDNIILRQQDRNPVLIDFGAVRETMGTVASAGGSITSSIVIGTPGYMPAEQAAGRPVYSSDLYSLGLTVIYLLTGKLPQELETDHITGEIIWRQYAPNVSPAFASILDKAIKSHPRDRFSSAKDMVDALQSGGFTIPLPVPFTIPQQQLQVPETLPLQVSPSHPSNKQNPAILGSLIAVTWLVVASVIFVFGIKPNSQPTPTQTATPITPTSSPTTSYIPPDDSTVNNYDQDVTNTLSPEQTIEEYYININSGKYQTAWRQQSPILQSNKEINPRGYTDYLKFWNTVKRVELEEINTLEQSSQTATVDVRLTYIKNTGNPDSYYWRYYLVWDAEENRWLLDDRKQLG